MTSMECGLANKIMSYDYDEALIELINLFCKNTYLEDIVFFFNFIHYSIIVKKNKNYNKA